MTDNLQSMHSPDMSGHDPMSRPIAWMTLSKVAARLADADLPRNRRTLRRYCERGDLDCRKTENALHQPQYFVDAASVETYIAQQKALLSASAGMPGRDRTGPDEAAPEISSSAVIETIADMTGSVRTSPDDAGLTRPGVSGELLEQLRERLADKDEEIKFLRSELQHRQTTDSALHDVIAAFRANAEAQRLAAAPHTEPSDGAPDMSGQTRSDPLQGRSSWTLQ